MGKESPLPPGTRRPVPGRSLNRVGLPALAILALFPTGCIFFVTHDGRAAAASRARHAARLEEDVERCGSLRPDRPPVGDPEPGEAFRFYERAIQEPEQAVVHVDAAVRTRRTGPPWERSRDDVARFVREIGPELEWRVHERRSAGDFPGEVRAALTLLRIGDDLWPDAPSLRRSGLESLRRILQEESVDGEARAEMQRVVAGLLRGRRDGARLVSRLSVLARTRHQAGTDGFLVYDGHYLTALETMCDQARDVARDAPDGPAVLRSVARFHAVDGNRRVKGFTEGMIEIANTEDRTCLEMEAVVLALAVRDRRDDGAGEVTGLARNPPDPVRPHPAGGDWEIHVASDGSLQIRWHGPGGRPELLLWLR